MPIGISGLNRRRQVMSLTGTPILTACSFWNHPCPLRPLARPRGDKDRDEDQETKTFQGPNTFSDTLYLEPVPSASYLHVCLGMMEYWKNGAMRSHRTALARHAQRVHRGPKCHPDAKTMLCMPQNCIRNPAFPAFHHSILPIFRY